MKTLYIEKNGSVDKNWVIATYPRIDKTWKQDATFTINGEDIEFLAFDVNLDDGRLKDFCRSVHTQTDSITMHSGIIDGTRIAGVVKRGNFLMYQGNEYMLETEIFDKRCGISFPLITQRRQHNKVTFVPLDLQFPTEIDNIERRLESICVLEGIDDEEQFTRETVIMIAIATSIYPRQLIWKFSEIPREITKLKRSLEDSGEVPFDLDPAYAIMTQEEKTFLNLDLFVGDISSSIDPHIKPINSLRQSQPRHAMNSTVARPTTPSAVGSGRNIDTLGDLSDLMRETHQLANRLIGNGEKEVRVVRRNGKIYISMGEK